MSRSREWFVTWGSRAPTVWFFTLFPGAAWVPVEKHFPSKAQFCGRVRVCWRPSQLVLWVWTPFFVGGRELNPMEVMQVALLGSTPEICSWLALWATIARQTNRKRA